MAVDLRAVSAQQGAASFAIARGSSHRKNYGVNCSRTLIQIKKGH
jgi:hypothetical protein